METFDTILDWMVMHQVRLMQLSILYQTQAQQELDETEEEVGAIAAAVASSAKNRPVAADLALVGEIGLSGEIRSVGQLPRRRESALEGGQHGPHPVHRHAERVGVVA